MAGRRKVERVHRIGKPTRNHPGRQTSSRKATNQEIIREAVRVDGFVRIRVTMQVKWAVGGNYVGIRGSGLVFRATDASTTNKFLEKVKPAMIELAQEMGVEIPEEE